ncbi:hypothetical protein J2S13_000393 [Oikeobacillus pervagus]|uniref:YxiS n=1 Tax=Oikeobacillus pervagus TaxID=1325931 RepID=A0AAJ1SW87_9BACI|nr:hypothetical protein [Oikeobacillus pervagus]MDQ0213998.1 hypothetical protein [Oikeobacillus pervagus]
MNSKQLEEKIIENYQKDEKMMILVFAQWCMNHHLDPLQLYKKAYPNQMENPALKEALALTVTKEESGPISNETVLGVLSLFGNDELAFIITEEIAKME